jgi:hypothetical protein
MARRRIGVPLGDQARDHRDHRADIGRRAGFVIGPQRTQGIHVGVVPADGLIRAFGNQRLQRARSPGLLPPQRLGVDLVIDIREVAHIGHVIRAVDVPQQAVEHVEHHDRPRIAQMRPVIDGGAADIHPHVLVVQRRKRLFPAGFRVVQADGGHGLVPKGKAVSPAGPVSLVLTRKRKERPA